MESDVTHDLERFLHRSVQQFYLPIAQKIEEKYQSDKVFRTLLKKWVNFSLELERTDRRFFNTIAKQYLYLVFSLIAAHTTSVILTGANGEEKAQTLTEKLKSLHDSEHFQPYIHELLQYFRQNLYSPLVFEFLSQIPLPSKIIPALASVIENIVQHISTNVSPQTLGYKMDQLMSSLERSVFGQYFTSEVVIDLICALTIRKKPIRLADFGCGSGLFLIHALRYLNYLSSKDHVSQIPQNVIIGIEISKFSSFIAALNLFTRSCIIKNDFSSLVITGDLFYMYPKDDMSWKQFFSKSNEIFTTRLLAEPSLPFTLPKNFDVILGNPPYTRQEFISKIHPQYKQKILARISQVWGNQVKFKRRSGFYVYFFMYSLSFLKNGGRLGYITSNSWLDADFGNTLKAFFFSTCKIIALIEPKERVFSDAGINTVITIVELCLYDKQARDQNTIRFVKFKRPLSEIFGKDTHLGSRFAKMKAFAETLEKNLHANPFTSYKDVIQVHYIKQHELYAEGVHPATKKYHGSTWSKYFRAPAIFFKILKHPKLTKLGNLCKVVRGYTTNAKKFFVIDPKLAEELKLPPDTLMPMINNPKNIKKLVLDIKDADSFLVLIEKTKSELMQSNAIHLLNYIKYGERILKKQQVTRKENWFILKRKKPAPLLVPRSLWQRYYVVLNKGNLYTECNFYWIYPYFKDELKLKALCAYLNSTFFAFLRELFGRTQLGLGALTIQVYEFQQIPILNIDLLTKDEIKKLAILFDKLSENKVTSIFEELSATNANELKLEDINKARRSLDQFIMQNLLNLSLNDEISIYKGLLRLISERKEKALH